MIDACYMFAAFGLLSMRRWGVVLYFVAHSITFVRLFFSIFAASSFFAVGSVRLVWFVGFPIAMLVIILPRWRQLR
jgi:hypothetical protein